MESAAFRQKVLSGLSWSTVSQLGKQILTFAISIVLIRRLSPSEFGLIAMVMVIANFANLFAGLGFSSALIQRQNVRSEQLSSVFWLNLVGGSLLMVIFIIAAPLVADFYGEPILTTLTIFISINFLIGSFGIVQHTLMVKNLNFQRLSIVQITAVGGAGVIAITMSYTGFGVWSLAVQSVAQTTIITLLLWRLSDWRPEFRFSWNSVKDLLGFSTHLLGTQVLNYWTRNIDNLLIGRVLGTAALGAYSRAYSMMLFPLTNVSRVIANVMFPSLSVISEDKARVKYLYLKTSRMIALITFPLMCGLFVVVEALVLTVFGPQWVEIIPILRVLCLVGLAQSIIMLNGTLYLSQNRADLQFKVGLFLKANVILGIVIGLQWGVVGVAIGYAIASLVNSYPSVSNAGKAINLRFIEFLQNLFIIFLCSALMAIAVWSFGLLLPSDWAHWLYLALQLPFGVVVYGVLLSVFNVKAFNELKALLIEQLKGWRSTDDKPSQHIAM